MYWWNVSKLAEDFREGRVDEKERFKYFLATFFASNIAVQLFIYFNGPFSTDGLISAAVSLTVAVVGIILCYRVNRTGDNTDFIARMICLGWPVGIRLVVMFSAFFCLMGLITAMPAAAYGPQSFLSAILAKVRDIWDGFPGLILVGSYYFDMYRHFAFVAKAQGLEDALQTREADWSGGAVALAIVGGIGVPIIMILSVALALDFAGTRISLLISLMAVGLWMLSFGSTLVWLRRRSMKRV